MQINWTINEFEKNKTYLRRNRNHPSQILGISKNHSKKFRNLNPLFNPSILKIETIHKIQPYNRNSDYQEEYFW